MERGICPIAVLYFALKHSFFNIQNYWSIRVQILPHFGSRDVIGHVTITPAVGGYL